HGQPLVRGIEARALWHRPALEHALHREAEVVVQPRGGVLLHHERAVAAVGLRPRGLARDREVALPAVLAEGRGDVRAAYFRLMSVTPSFRHESRIRSPDFTPSSEAAAFSSTGRTTVMPRSSRTLSVRLAGFVDRTSTGPRIRTGDVLTAWDGPFSVCAAARAGIVRITAS